MRSADVRKWVSVTDSPRTVVVTGSGSGLGLATSRRLVESGYRVIGVDLRDADVEVDLRDAMERRSAVEQIVGLCDGHLDSLVTFAGVSAFAGLGGDDIVSINYFGTVELASALCESLEMGIESSVVAVSSNAATTAPGVNESLVESCLAGDELEARAAGREVGPVGAYSASKFAVARWVRRHAPSDEWIGRGITLNAIVPGLFETPMTQAMRQLPDASAMLKKSRLPIGRSGQPTEVAELVAFLVGPNARFIVGSLMFIDGGKDAALRADDWPSPRRRRGGPSVLPDQVDSVRADRANDYYSS